MRLHLICALIHIKFHTHTYVAYAHTHMRKYDAYALYAMYGNFVKVHCTDSQVCTHWCAAYAASTPIDWSIVKIMTHITV